MIANLFGPDLGYVVIIVLVVMVAGSQLPKIARNIGTAGKEFRQAQQEAEKEEAEREHTAQAQAAVPPAPVAAAPPVASATDRSLSGNQPSPRPSSAEFDALGKAREDQVHQETTG